MCEQKGVSIYRIKIPGKSNQGVQKVIMNIGQCSTDPGV